ncbi:MAG: serine/threonine-protein phosphatase [Oscillospiraceae bacterium]|nr:serine/threonine-protein phosphatase [Oscillospiraceae bacterium]
MNFDVFTYSNRGGRDYNEDCAGHRIEGGSGIFVVADGLGGLRLGDVASAEAVDTIVSLWSASNRPDEMLTSIVSEANNRILGLQKQNNTTMKTTAALVSVFGDDAIWGNVGDSRVYFIHNNELHAFTNDHSVAYKKYKAKEITREQIAFDEDQSQLLRALGNPERNELEIYKSDVKLLSGDAFFLCSDGAWEFLKDEEILIDFLKSETAQQWAELMLLRIIERVPSNHDNLTLMTVIIQ